MSIVLMDRAREMRSLSLVVAVLAAFVMFGCAPGFGQKTAPPVSLICHAAPQCTVPVEVDCAQSPCKIKIASQFENVDANGFRVVWEIVQKPGQSYTFKNPGGIFFKTAEGQQAYNCQSEMGGRRFGCQGNKDGKEYEYGIELTGAPPASKLDPWIVNR